MRYNGGVDVLLRTKLFVPDLRRGVVARPRLLARLDQGLSRRLSLVVAPAGFGKTTVVTQWLDQLRRPLGWLSLDQYDNEPNRFFTYLLAAIQTALPQVGLAMSASLASGQSVDDQALVPALINELSAADQPLTLVLDDYHLIHNEVIQTRVTELIDYLPAGIHLVLTSRDEPPLPLPRWRVRGQLTEIRQDDLRFDEAESGRFMRETMALTLPEKDIAQLKLQTEGWIAGLQLAALSLQGSGASELVFASIHGADRHVSDYLVQEVLQNQSPEVTTFLLKSAILERFNAPLCDAVLGCDTSRQILLQLDQANLFLVPLDRQRNWFRFHHLFGQLLRQKLTEHYEADVIEQLHLRAVAWYRANGFMDEAINHALLASAYELAAEMVAGYSLEDIYNQGGTTLVKGWYEALPASVVRQYPRATVMAAGAYLVVGQLEETQRCLDLIANEPAVKAEYQLFRSIIIRNDAADYETSLRLAKAAYEGLAGHGLEAESMALMQLAINHLDMGNLAEAGGALELLRERISHSNRRHLNLEMQAIHIRALVALSQLDFVVAERLCQQALSMGRGEQGVLSPMIGWVHALVAQIFYEWDDIAQAEAHTDVANHWAERSGMTDIMFQSIKATARLAIYRGDVVAIREIAESLQAMAGQTRIVNVADLIRTQVAFYLLRVGAVDDAVRWANAAPWQLAAEPTFASFEPMWILGMVRLAESRALAEKGLAEPIVPMVERLLKVTQATEHRYASLQVLLLQALLLDWLDRPEAASAAFNEALDLAEPASIRRLFLDCGQPLRPLLQRSLTYKPAYVRDLLHRLDGPAVITPAPATVPMISLTDREQDVLQAIAAGLSNREIETSLFISKNTVRTHLKNLYSKLAVSSRTQAVAVAREQGLL